MTATWTPEPLEPLIIAQEDDRAVSATISVCAEAPAEVAALTWLAIPALPPQAQVTVDGATLNVFFPHFDGVWPINEIRYLRHGQQGTCTQWADLPDEAEDVIAYRKDAAGMRRIALTLTAELTATPALVATYRIDIYPNYTPGRDALQDAVNARRH